MTFTETDAEDDAKIKNQAKGSAKKVAARESGQIYQFYKNVCDELGVDPGVDLVDMAIRVIEDDGFAEQIESTEVSLRQAMMSEIREEDLEFVERMQERFGNKKTEKSTVEQLIEQRLERQMKGPMSPLDKMGVGSEDQEKKALRRELQEMRREMQEMKNSMGANSQSDSPAPNQTVNVSPSSKTEEERSGEIDGLFNDGPPSERTDKKEEVKEVIDEDEAREYWEEEESYQEFDEEESADEPLSTDDGVEDEEDE